MTFKSQFYERQKKTHRGSLFDNKRHSKINLIVVNFKIKITQISNCLKIFNTQTWSML